MSITNWVMCALWDRVVTKRNADLVIGGRERPYLFRWHLIPRNRLLNIYLHHFARSDDDRALHDHPWINLSWLIEGTYTEHTITQGGIHHRNEFKTGDWRFRLTGRLAHRIELTHGRCWTLFITGPKYRHWGFHCPDKGWVHHSKFSDPDDRGAIGGGCE